MTETNEGTPDEITSEIIDLPGLFRYSGLVDALRDGAKVLLRHKSDSDTLKGMATRYNRLREELQKALTPEAAELTGEWAEELNPDTSSIESIFMACNNLARWMDLVHQTPSFLMGQELQQMNNQQMMLKVRSMGGAGLPGGSSPQLPSFLEDGGTPKQGMYL